jgi:phosphoglycolate phosphatase
MKPKYLIFDFDGTIVDSLDTVFDIFNQLSIEFNFPKFEENEKERYRALGMRALIKEKGIPFYRLPFMARRVREEFSKEIANLEPFPGLVDVLNRLVQKGFILGILTSNSEENVRQFLHKHAIVSFNFVFGGSSVFGKDKVLKKLFGDKQINYEEAIYIGDEPRDVEAAHKCAVKAVAVSWGYSDLKLLKAAKPDWLIKEPEELLEIQY